MAADTPLYEQDAQGFTRLSNADANHDAEGYLLDASGQRATVGNSAAVTGAINASIVSARDSAVEEQKARLEAERAAKASAARTIPFEQFRNMSPREQKEAIAYNAMAGDADRLEFSKTQAAADNVLRQHADTLNQATGYYDMALKKANYVRETKRTVDAADFLTAFSNSTDHSPAAVAKMLAKTPLAAHDPSVQSMLGQVHSDSQLSAQLQKTEASQHENEYANAYQKNLLMPDDVKPYDPANPEASIFDADGTTNHPRAVRRIIENSSKQYTAKAAHDDMNAARGVVTAFAGIQKERALTPAEARANENALAVIGAGTQTAKGKAEAATAPAPDDSADFAGF